MLIVSAGICFPLNSEKVFASCAQTEYGVANVIDGDTTTFWQSATDPLAKNFRFHQFIRLDLYAAGGVARVVIVNRRDCCQSNLDSSTGLYRMNYSMYEG